MTALLKSQLVENDFENVVHAWLSGENDANLAPLMYDGDISDARWREGHSSPHYYVEREEMAIIARAARELDIAPNCLIDLGPGGTEAVKNKSALLALKTGAQQYFPVDLTYHMAKNAADVMQKKFGVSSHPVYANFFSLLPLARQNALISLLGITIGNLETILDRVQLQARLSEVFRNFYRTVGGMGWLLISCDTNQNAEEIIKCYDNPEFNGLVRSCVEKAICSDGFENHVTFNPENYQMATGLRAKQDISVYFDGQDYDLAAGTFLPVLNSYRFPAAFLQMAAAAAGWQSRQVWQVTGRVHYFLFEAK